MEIAIPISEDPVERTRFYAYLVSELRSRKETLDLIMEIHNKMDLRMHERMDEMHKTVDEMDRIVRQMDTRNKTVVAVAFAVWTIFGSVFTWVWDKTSSKADSYIQKIETISSALEKEQLQHQQGYAELQQLKAMRGQVQTIQQDLDRLMEKR